MRGVKGFQKREKHHLWKGRSVGYKALRGWVVRNFGSPKECEICGTKKAKKYEWANKSHTYKRKRNDWVRLCTSCHILLDKRRGEGNGKSVLMEDDIISIRNLYKHRDFSLRDLASIYNVGKSTVYNIIIGRTWGHVR